MGRHGENIYQRKDGRWEARINIGKDSSGRTRYRSVYGHSYREAKQKQRLCAQETPVPSSAALFSDAVFRWLESIRSEVKEQSFVKYRLSMENHILPCLGGLPLASINAELIERFLAEKRDSGRMRATGGLSANTIRGLSILLQAILDFAYQNKMGVAAPIRIKKPRAEKKKVSAMKAYEQRQLEQYLLAQPHGACLAIYLALHTGMRLGELCALKWTEVDLIEQRLYVQGTAIRDQCGKLSIGTPKSETSNRTIPLSYSLSSLLSAEREISESQFVFPSPRQDSFINPRTLQYRYQKVLKNAGLSKYTFHALRHTFATRWIECGLDVKSLSEVLGHGSVQVTLDNYVHSSEKLKREGIERLESISGQNSGQIIAGSIA